MTKRGRVILVGALRDAARADRAVHELRQAGFRGGLVEVMVRDGERPGNEPAKKPKTTRATRPGVKPPGKRQKGGAGPDGIIKEFVEVAAAATELIPGVGPKLAVGLVDGVLGDPDDVRGKLSAMGFAQDDVLDFDRRLAAGEALVVVRANARHRQAAAVLRRCGADEIRRVS